MQSTAIILSWLDISAAAGRDDQCRAACGHGRMAEGDRAGPIGVALG